MKQIIIAAAALAMSAGVALAENPFVGMPADQVAQDKAFSQPSHSFLASKIEGKVDYIATASINNKETIYQDGNGSAHRFGNASPSSYQN